MKAPHPSNDSVGTTARGLQDGFAPLEARHGSTAWLKLSLCYLGLGEKGPGQLPPCLHIRGT